MALVGSWNCDDGSVGSVGGSPSAGTLDPAIVSGSITNAVDNGFGLIRITSVGHTLTTGNQVTITGVGGTTEADGTWTITVVDGDTFDLNSSTFTNTYTSGGTFSKVLPWSWSAEDPPIAGTPGSLFLTTASHVDLPTLGSFDAATSFTVAVWVRRASYAGGRSAAIALSNAAGDFTCCLGVSSSNGAHFGVDVGHSYISAQGATGSSSYALNTWYHLAVVCKSSGSLDFYQDGVYKSSLTYDANTLGAATNSNDWSLGSEKDLTAPDDYAYPWDGEIAFAKVYDSELSAGDIAALAGVTLPSNSLTIAAFYDDEEIMPVEFQLSQSTKPITFTMRHSATGLLLTGASPTVRLSKNGGAWAAPAGAVGEMTLGGYSIAPSATDFNTLGELNLIATAANCITTRKDMMVVAHSPTIGFPTGAVGAASGAMVGTGTGTVVLTSGGVASANVTTWNGTAVATPDTAGYPKVTIKSGTGTGELSLSSGIARSYDASGANVASASALSTAQTSLNTIAGYLDTEVAAIKAKTDLIPANPAAVSDIPTATLISNTVAAALNSAHGTGAWTTADVSALATASQLAASSAGIVAAIPSAASVKAAVWSSTSTNTGYTMEKLVEIVASGSPAGKVSGAGTGTETFKHVGSTAAAMVVTVDSSGNRTAVTIL